MYKKNDGGHFENIMWHLHLDIKLWQYSHL